MVDEQALLEVLIRIGEVHAQHLHVATRCGVAHVRNGAEDLAAECCVGVANGGVAASLNVGVGEVDGIVLPVLQHHGDQLRAVADDELDVVRVRAGALVTQDDDGLGVTLELDDEGAVGHLVLARAGDRDLDRLGQRGVLRNLDIVRDRGILPGLGCGTVDRCAGQTDARVGRINLRHGDVVTGVLRDLDDDVGVRRRCGGAVVQTTEAAQRGKTPVLVAALRDREVLSLEGGEAVALGLVIGSRLDGLILNVFQGGHLA